ncbi:MAG: hypothetical protein JWQ72_1771 [Polaromonas sp.]|nr:hypothetical protein [Polaromonas sp.]
MPDIAALVQDLSSFSGVDGCALVETDTGMAWHHAGRVADMERIGEAAVEFWRLQQRLAGPLEAFGPLQSAAYSFSSQVIALFPCSETRGLVLVCVAAKTGMAWQDWGPKVVALRKALAAL